MKYYWVNQRGKSFDLLFLPYDEFPIQTLDYPGPDARSYWEQKQVIRNARTWFKMWCEEQGIVPFFKD